VANYSISRNIVVLTFNTYSIPSEFSQVRPKIIQFSSEKFSFQTNLWEIENNGVLKFSDLIRQGKSALMGTHDMVAHIAGLDGNHWPLLKKNAQRVFQAITSYFNSTTNPSIAALILP
jgi:hypothetical protein